MKYDIVNILKSGYHIDLKLKTFSNNRKITLERLWCELTKKFYHINDTIRLISIDNQNLTFVYIDKTSPAGIVSYSFDLRQGIIDERINLLLNELYDVIDIVHPSWGLAKTYKSKFLLSEEEIEKKLKTIGLEPQNLIEPKIGNLVKLRFNIDTNEPLIYNGSFSGLLPIQEEWDDIFLISDIVNDICDLLSQTNQNREKPLQNPLKKCSIEYLYKINP